jgi:hypothetical protein
MRALLPLLLASIEEKRQWRRMPSTRDAALGHVAAAVIVVFFFFSLPLHLEGDILKGRT